VRIPKKITPCPLIDVVVELRFETGTPPDAVFGIIYQELKEQYAKVDKLPIMQLPDEIRSHEPNFRFSPYYKLTSHPFVIQIGPNVLAVSCPGEYIGWEQLCPTILDIYQKLSALGIVRKPLRIGIRYINFFDFNVFDKTILKLMLGEDVLQTDFATIRLQIKDADFTNTLQISNNATVNVQDKSLKGSVIDIDTFREDVQDFFNNMKAIITNGHETEKRLFFGLLKPDFLETLKPEY
jgi:uncharacterized protein (TIGR04255 family)